MRQSKKFWKKLCANNLEKICEKNLKEKLDEIYYEAQQINLKNIINDLKLKQSQLCEHESVRAKIESEMSEFSKYKEFNKFKQKFEKSYKISDQINEDHQNLMKKLKSKYGWKII